MKKRVLLVTTVSGFIPQFEMNNVRILQSMGYEVHYASNYHIPSYGDDNHRLDGTGIIRHQVDFVRSPFNYNNFVVYRQLSALMRQIPFDLIHCHTPMGAVMARLASHATHTGPVVYTAHGFHFYRGASPIHWLCYYPMERVLSRYTDQLLCINQEDYKCAKETFHAKYIDYIPGVGIDLTKISEHDESFLKRKKAEIGVPDDRIIVLSSGELIKRKNHETVIRAMALLQKQGKINTFNTHHIHYVICGHGKLEADLKKLVHKLGVSGMVTFTGYREDMLDVYQMADVFLFPSYQEGLPMALLEAMACGLPVICSDIRGCRDLMGNMQSETKELRICSGGIMIKKVNDVKAYGYALLRLLDNSDLCGLKNIGYNNKIRSRKFSLETVDRAMRKVYQRLEQETQKSMEIKS